MVQGSGGMEETGHCFQAQESWEAVCRRGSHEVEGLPVALKDMVGEEAEAPGAEAHGRWGEASTVFSVQDVGRKLLCGDHVGRLAVELRQQAYLTDRGLLGTLPLATALKRSDHVLT